MGKASDPQTLDFKNIGQDPLEISSLKIVGPNANAFKLSPHTLPIKIEAGSSLNTAVTFAPTSIGSLQATLVVESNDADNANVQVPLYGLGSEGEQGALEPPLQNVLDTLGYGVEVGSTELELGTNTTPLGEELSLPLFEKAGSGPVTLKVVARYGPTEPLEYGYFQLDSAKAARQKVGSIAEGDAQKLLPALASGNLSFDPGEGVFGVYTEANHTHQYSLDGLNSGQAKHAMRIYPLKNRSGRALPNSYLIGMEEASNGDYQDSVMVISNVRPAGSAPDTLGTSSTQGWQPLFNGTDLDGWYSYLPSKGKNNDPQGIFKVENGMIHILDKPAGSNQDFGYIATQESYSNYHLRLEYMWGGKRFAPRNGKKRDSGVIYHVQGNDGIWPRGVEYQIQEGDTGDFWMLGGTRMTTTVNSPGHKEPDFASNGVPYETKRGDFVRVGNSGSYDKREGWNTVDIIVKGDSVMQMVNGVVNNHAFNLLKPDGSPLTSGRILIQAEGAEVFYRNIEIRPLD